MQQMAALAQSAPDIELGVAADDSGQNSDEDQGFRRSVRCWKYRIISRIRIVSYSIAKARAFEIYMVKIQNTAEYWCPKSFIHIRRYFLIREIIR